MSPILTRGLRSPRIAGLPVLSLLPLLLHAGGITNTNSQREWNQWLGGPARTLSVPDPRPGDSPDPAFQELWRRPLGSGYAGLSVWGTNAITAMTDGKQDFAVLLDAHSGVERWRFVLGRTRKRAEGVPPGPLSTPAIDAEACYVQALDGRMACLELATGALRWEVSLKRAFGAHEPGYGFASSPLLWNETVILLPAGSPSASVVALDCRTGNPRWKAALGTSTEYASATLHSTRANPQIVAQLASKLVGLDPAEGRLVWEVLDVDGGLWTPLVLRDGSVFFPISNHTQLRRPDASGAPMLWSSPVFEGAMGPVVEVQGMLLGHHKRRLTALDASTGDLLWRRNEESDGPLLSLGALLVFLNDRTGTLELLRVHRTGSELRHRQTVLKPVRIESPLTFAHGILYIRTPAELVALETGPKAPPTLPLPGSPESSP